MSVRKMLYLVSFLMTLLPLLLFSYYEYGQVNSRAVESRKNMLTGLAILQGSELSDTCGAVRSLIEANTAGITGNLNVSALTGANSEAKNVSGALVKAVNAVKASGAAAGMLEYMVLTNGEGLVLAASNAALTGDTFAPLKSDGDGGAVFRVAESRLRDSDYGILISIPLNGGLSLLSFVSMDAYAAQEEIVWGQQTGYSFLADENGVIVYHPIRRYIGTAIENEDMAAAAKSIDDNPQDVKGEGRIFGAMHIYGSHAMPELGCSVYAIQDKKDVQKSNSPFVADAFIVSVLFVVISMAVVVPLLQSRIIKPIFALKKCMNSADDVGFGICDTQLDNEIGELIDGYNQMVEQLTDQMSSLKLSNEALVEAEEKLKHDKEKLRISEQRFKSATELSTIAVFELVTYTNEFFCSDSWEAITTYKPPSIYPLDYVLRNIIHPDHRAALIDWFDKMDTRFDDDMRIIVADGSLKWVHITMAAVDDDSTNIKKVSGTITDINERMVAMELTNYVAYHESLTGFPRRVLYVNDVSKKLTLLGGDKWGAVIILSMENIRRVNDIFGFNVGDQVIMLIAAELTERYGDQMYCARNTGNSFLLYCECPRDIDYVDKMCDNLLDIFSKPFNAGDMSVLVKAHVGVALCPDHGRDVEELIQNADIAMHEGRYVRKDDSVVFDPIMLAKVRRTHQIMEVLRDFEANQALYIQYQPIVNMEKRCIGFEALVRMDISPIGYISPVEFIPLAEESKMIIPIGRAILKNSCVKTMELLNKGYDFDHISVNVSTVQLEDEGFLEMFHSVVEETGIPPEKLQIEVTESIMISDMDLTSEKLGQLRRCGVKIALDDFGTGYSSMKYLRVIPLDVMKIDKHFIDEISNEKQQLFAFTMIQMAHEIGLRVVAEGVENQMQFDILKERGCDSIQGFFTGRPLYESGMEDFLKEH